MSVICSVKDTEETNVIQANDTNSLNENLSEIKEELLAECRNMFLDLVAELKER